MARLQWYFHGKLTSSPEAFVRDVRRMEMMPPLRHNIFTPLAFDQKSGAADDLPFRRVLKIARAILRKHASNKSTFIFLWMPTGMQFRFVRRGGVVVQQRVSWVKA